MIYLQFQQDADADYEIYTSKEIYVEMNDVEMDLDAILDEVKKFLTMVGYSTELLDEKIDTSYMNASHTD